MTLSGIFVRPFTWVLERIGFRRRILYLSYFNWEQVDWRQVFESSFWIRAAYKLHPVDFDDIMSKGNVSLANQVAISVTAENYRDLSVDGFVVWELAKTSILAALEKPVMRDVGEQELRFIRHFYRDTIICLTGGVKILDEVRPWALLATQGCQHIVRPVVEKARKRGMVTVAAEGSFLRDYFFCDNLTGMIVNRHAAGRIDMDWLPSIEFGEAQRQKLQDLKMEFGESKRVEHITKGVDYDKDIRAHLRLSHGRKIAVFIGQVLTDASIVMDSPVFPDPVDLIKRVYDYFSERPDWDLVIRLHPKEVTGLSWSGITSLGGMPEGEPEYPHGIPYDSITLRRLQEIGLSEKKNIRIVSESSVNTNVLLDMADVGITVNSQAGFEMLMKYKTVVVAGDAFYSKKGFTLDVSCNEALAGILDVAVSSIEVPEEQRFKIDKFAYNLIFHRMFRRDLQGQRERLLKVFDGYWGDDIRSCILRRDCRRFTKVIPVDPNV